jgi:VanZ family protein
VLVNTAPAPEKALIQPRIQYTISLGRLLRVVWAALIAVVVIGTLLPARSAPMEMLDALGINDKVEHVLAYLSLAFLPALHESRRRLAFVAPLLVALGVALEFGQRLSPGRDFESGDMIADAVGVTAGVAMGLWAKPAFAGFMRGKGFSG